MAGTAAGDDPAEHSARQRAEHLARMKELAASIHVYAMPGRKETEVGLLPEPVLRYADPTRQLDESSLWIWGAGGRPAAIVAIEFYPQHKRGPRWLYEIASLSMNHIAVERGSDLNWTATAPGLVLRAFPDVLPVADRPALRLTQMKELRRRFAAHEQAPVGGRIELRPLPNPLYRYEDAASGLMDAALFSFANGTNPEVLLVLEAQAKQGSATWQFGLVQTTGAEVFVQLDGQEIWTRGQADPPSIRSNYTNGWIPQEPASQ